MFFYYYSLSRFWSWSWSRSWSRTQPWTRSRAKAGPGPVIFLVPALVPVKIYGPITQWSCAHYIMCSQRVPEEGALWWRSKMTMKGSRKFLGLKAGGRRSQPEPLKVRGFVFLKCPDIHLLCMTWPYITLYSPTLISAFILLPYLTPP